MRERTHQRCSHHQINTSACEARCMYSRARVLARQSLGSGWEQGKRGCTAPTQLFAWIGDGQLRHSALTVTPNFRTIVTQCVGMAKITKRPQQVNIFFRPHSPFARNHKIAEQFPSYPRRIHYSPRILILTLVSVNTLSLKSVKGTFLRRNYIRGVF
jgi:hypothetical protein